MNALLPDTKYLYIVRDPISRALIFLRRSLQRRSKRGEEESAIIERWLNKQLDGGRYSKHILNINKVLGENKKIIYLPFRLIKNTPQELIDRVELHMEISKGNYKDLPLQPFNKTSNSVVIRAKAQATTKRKWNQK